MPKQFRGELVVVGFNYNLLETKTADKVRSTADRIKEKLRISGRATSVLHLLHEPAQAGKQGHGPSSGELE